MSAGKYPEGLKERNEILRGCKNPSIHGIDEKISTACILLNIKNKKLGKKKQETDEHSCLALLKGVFEPVRNPSAFENMIELMQTARSVKYSKQ